MNSNAAKAPDCTRELLELQSLVIQNSVHEIRALLLAGGYAKILLEDAADRLTLAERAYLVAVIENTRQIKDVLATLGRTAEANAWQVERFALEDLLEEAIDEFARSRGQERGHEVELRVHWNTDAECTVGIIGNRQILRDSLAGVLRLPLWAGPRNLTIAREKGMISLRVEAPARIGATLMASQMQDPTSTFDRRGSILGGVRLEHLEEAIRAHGGYVSMKQISSDCAECTIRLPAVAVTRRKRSHDSR